MKTSRQGRRLKAFAKVLDDRGVSFVAVDEAKKAIFSGAGIEPFDFLIYSSQGDNLLALLRPVRSAISQGDISMLAEWEGVFGKGFAAVVIIDDPGLGYPVVTLAECRTPPQHAYTRQLAELLGLAPASASSAQGATVSPPATGYRLPATATPEAPPCP